MNSIVSISCLSLGKIVGPRFVAQGMCMCMVFVMRPKLMCDWRPNVPDKSVSYTA